MSKINTRSPYFIYVTDTSLTGVQLDLTIYTGSQATVPATTYSLYSTALNEESTFEISELVDGYISDGFNGVYNSDNVWVRYVVTKEINDVPQASESPVVLSGFEGFGYFPEGSNPQLDSVVLQSNNVIVASDKDAITLPLHVVSGETVQVKYYKDGEVIYMDEKTFIDDSSDLIQYSTNSIGDIDLFTSRVLLDGGTIEAKECVEASYDDYYENVDADRIDVCYGSTIDSYTVKEVEECKYETYKVVFKNKFGAWQDLWFFKRSDLSIKTESSKYMSNVVTAGSYDTSQHQYKTFSKNGKESLKLSSGFYPEEYNEVFKQMLISEQVYIVYENQTLPLQVKDSSFVFKQRVNEKLINYTINVEFAFDKINNIR